MNISDVLRDHSLSAVSGGNNIKSMQKGSAYILGSSVDVTISAVDLTKAIIIIRNPYGNMVKSENDFMGIFTSSTSIRLSRTYSDGASYTVYWEVIEFNNVKSLQTGTISTTSGTISPGVTFTIAEINPLKALIFLTEQTTTYPYEITADARIVSATTVQVYTDSNDKTIYWQVIEFN